MIHQLNLFGWVMLAVLWVGHACVWTYLLNNAYGRPISKRVLKPFRLTCGVVIAAYPALLYSLNLSVHPRDDLVIHDAWSMFVLAYLCYCGLAAAWFLVVTIGRLIRPRPKTVQDESTRTLDLWPELGPALIIGDGKWRWLPRLPLNGVFRLDITRLTLAPPRLPAAWDGLSILLVSDLHFHGTPSRAFFQRVIDEINTEPPADIVALAGDFVDTDTHHEWIGPLLGQLTWTEAGLAILGNHDAHHRPDRVRGELATLGYRVLSQRWEELSVRGVPLVACGHEGPWIGGPPDLSAAPAAPFRLCLSHTPDNFYWGVRHGIDLMLCGHVHGGQVRLPLIGSIFVPSAHGRRFDMGVFQDRDTVMVVGRGLSGKEPLRFRCNPQVIRITLKAPLVADPPGPRNAPARPPS